ncbi:MAG: sigma-54-dependent Fis family transcriptional regulator [Deltaproteobacteria bacterium]|nr:sigma-54-dependent Fis family transcriptional regulator [Deltaproteobacteria bacterium]
MAGASQLNTAEAAWHSVPEHTLVGAHPTIIKLRALIERVAATDTTVLITGESGSGKEIVAREIHTFSRRSSRNFVPINCAAIPNELMESEMFGHQRGAFTGAALPRHGLFSLADRGTIFLDEISEMPLQLQAKLLRVLEDGFVRAVGSDRAVRVDARIIAATNTDLMTAVKKGKFREDLFYRLQVVPVMVPPLRERRSDIPLLVDFFLERNRERFGGQWSITREAMVHLWSYDWPGNVRELENLIERLVILSEGPVIDVAMLPENLKNRHCHIAEVPMAAELGEGGVDLNALVRELEGRMINEALKLAGGNKQAAARLVGLKRTTFSAKLRRCGVIAPSDRGESA